MEISRHWRLQKQRYRLEGEICANGHPVFPPRDVCPHCAATAKTPYEFSGKGEVYSFTTVYDAPEGFEDMTPYTVALIALEEGPFVTAQLTDVDNRQVEIGMRVEMVTRRLFEDRGHDGDRGKGPIIYGPKFRPPIPKIT